MKTSVLIVGYKQAKIMPYLLKAYDLQSTKDFEVIYVENGAGSDEQGIRLLKETKLSVPKTSLPTLRPFWLINVSKLLLSCVILFN